MLADKIHPLFVVAWFVLAAVFLVAMSGTSWEPLEMTLIYTALGLAVALDWPRQLNNRRSANLQLAAICASVSILSLPFGKIVATGAPLAVLAAFVLARQMSISIECERVRRGITANTAASPLVHTLTESDDDKPETWLEQVLWVAALYLIAAHDAIRNIIQFGHPVERSSTASESP